MRIINPSHCVSADFQEFDVCPPVNESAEFSYVMSAKGYFARLDIYSHDCGSFEILGSLVPETTANIKLVTWIPITTTDSDEFEAFVEQGPRRVLATEPETFLWFSLKHKIDSDRYVIIDLYQDESGLLKHNEGEVAAALKSNAPKLVAGGWKAVVSNAVVFEVNQSKG